MIYSRVFRRALGVILLHNYTKLFNKNSYSLELNSTLCLSPILVFLGVFLKVKGKRRIRKQTHISSSQDQQIFFYFPDCTLSRLTEHQRLEPSFPSLLPAEIFTF